MADKPSWLVPEEEYKKISPMSEGVPAWLESDPSNYSPGAGAVDAIVGPGVETAKVIGAVGSAITPDFVKDTTLALLQKLTAVPNYLGGLGRAGAAKAYETLMDPSNSIESGVRGRFGLAQREGEAPKIISDAEALGALKGEKVPSFGEFRERAGLGGPLQQLYKSKYVDLNAGQLLDLAGDIGTNPATYPMTFLPVGKLAQSLSPKIAKTMGGMGRTIQKTPQEIPVGGQVIKKFSPYNSGIMGYDEYLQPKGFQITRYPEGAKVPNISGSLSEKGLRDKTAEYLLGKAKSLQNFSESQTGAKTVADFVQNPFGGILQSTGKGIYKSALRKLDEASEKAGKTFGDASELLWKKGISGSAENIEHKITNTLDDLDRKSYQTFDLVKNMAGPNGPDYLFQGRKMVSPTDLDMKYAYDALDKAEKLGLHGASVSRMRKIVDQYRTAPSKDLQGAIENLRQIDRHSQNAYKMKTSTPLSDDVIKSMRRGIRESLDNATALIGAQHGQSEIANKLSAINKDRSLLISMHDQAYKMATKEADAKGFPFIDSALATGTGAAAFTGHPTAAAAGLLIGAGRSGKKYLESTAGKTRFGKGIYRAGKKRYAVPAMELIGQSVQEDE